MLKMCSDCKYFRDDIILHPCRDCIYAGGKPFWESKKTESDNPYWERICKLSERQRAKGVSTYGQGLENNSAPLVKRIEHLEEELIDGLMYCEWIKEKILELEGKNGRVDS